jgi:type II secretory pathway predicted ATPase ExeA
MSSVVLNRFQLQREPFSAQIATDAVYEFSSFKQGRLRLEESLHRRGMLLLVGEPGSGKTALLRSFCGRLAASSHHVLYAASPAMKNPARPVIESLLAQAGEKVPFNNVGRGLALLGEALKRQYEQGKLPVIIVDDAHHLNADGWLLFKTLSNFEMDSKQPVLMIFVGARAELLSTLSWSRLDEVRGRLLFCYHLRGLEESETLPYLAAHLQWAGCSRPLFPKEVAVELHRHARGLPRLVNRLAYSCLTAAACDQSNLDGDATALPCGLDCLKQALTEHLFSASDGRSL